MHDTFLARRRPRSKARRDAHLLATRRTRRALPAPSSHFPTSVLPSQLCLSLSPCESGVLTQRHPTLYHARAALCMRVHPDSAQVPLAVGRSARAVAARRVLHRQDLLTWAGDGRCAAPARGAWGGGCRGARGERKRVPYRSGCVWVVPCSSILEWRRGSS